MGDRGGDGSGEGDPPGRRLAFLAVFYLCASLSLSFFFSLLVGGVLRPPVTCAQRTCGGRAEETGVTNFFMFALLLGTYLFGMTPLICREIEIKINKKLPH
jgi:hypothetical protein